VNAVADALSIPRNSPLAVGWRAALVALLEEHGLVDVLDTVSAFAELAVRREPDTAEDPLDRPDRDVTLADLMPSRFKRRMSGKSDLRREELDKPITRRTFADPALRRIEAIEMPADRRQALGQRGPGRPRLEE